jgi:predicted unusual protein kinase regulating ubiquinone biosynthesis (AarF/ABC1/UbiB family)
MTKKRPSRKVSRIKTGQVERRLTLAGAGVIASTRLAAGSALNLFASKASREHRNKRVLGKQARYLVGELGKLKGSVVKIGQMMALYGEHFLPEEVTEALHTLEDQTAAMDWGSIRPHLVAELGKRKMAELDIDREPIAAASLGQVHRARRREDGKQLCLKIQYPGIATAIDSDINAVASLLRMANLLSRTDGFDEWLAEVQMMMHREVDYQAELEATKRFRHLLRADKRFVVPKVYEEYSTNKVLATSWETGLPISAPEVQSLSEERRNGLASAARDLLLKELFEWGEMQTDPNFGNYRIRPARNKRSIDKIVLLDFGAVQQYPESFLDPLRQVILGAYQVDPDQIKQAAIALDFISADAPDKVIASLAKVCIELVEPLASEFDSRPDAVLNDEGEYCWRASELPNRLARRARKSAVSRYFSVPPKEFLFINRKLVGVYTLLSVLDAQLDSRQVLQSYL